MNGRAQVRCRDVAHARGVVIARAAANGPAVSLSPREQEMARMVARGCANKTIASVLDISS
jgi:DNA-binding CsgD family transcriptional regulator